MELYGSLSNISGSVTASAFSGSFVGDGAGLYNLPASGVTGLNLSQITSGNATASISSTAFTVNKNTQIQGNLSVTGSIIATEYIVSSSVTYMTTSFASGSTAFGNDNNDVHQFTGSVQITGSISLNGQAIGTGKLDETTFQSYTSSNDGRVSALETSSGSLNSFTSSIDTTIKSKLNTENVISGSIQVDISGTTGYSTFSSSISSSILDLSSSVATTTSGLTSNITSLSSSLTSSIGSLSSSVATTTNNLSSSIVSLSSSAALTTSNLSSSIGSLSSSVATTTSGLSSDIGNLSSSVATTTLNTKNRVDSIENKTGSYATTGSNLFIGTQTHSGSILPSVDNAYDLGSTTYQWRDVYISSGSLYIDGTKVISSTAQELVITTDNGQSIKILESGTDSIILQTADGDVELKSSGDGDILLDPTNGKITLKGTVEVLNGSKIQSSVGGTPIVFAGDVVVSGSIDITGTIEGINLTDLSSSVNTRLGNLESSGGSLNSFTSSTNNRLTSLETTSGSLNTYTSSNNIKLGIIETATSSLNTFTSSTSTRLSSIETTTGSLIGVNTTQNSRLDSLETTSGSILSVNTTQNSRLTSIETKTGSYATTGSNIFQGDQTITGSLYVSQNLIIAGSSSIQNISSSVLNIGDNIITVNAVNPSVRFGGLAVIDSGSNPQVSGSMLFDSVKNEWLFVHQNQGTITSSVLLMGPETYNDLGNETYITANRLVKSTGIEHLTNSNISDDGTTVTILSNAVVNGTFSATGTTLVSGSSQISHDSTTGYVANRHIDHTAVSITAGNGLSGGGDISSTRTITLDTASATFTSGVKSKINADGVVSGSSQVSFNGITDKPTLVSGSAQITNIANSQLTNSSFNIGTTSISLGRASASQTLTGVNIDGNSQYFANNYIGQTDANSIWRAGSYTFFNGVNVPGGDFGLISFPTWSSTDSNSRYNIQLGANIGGNLRYRSTNINGAASWSTILSDANYNSYSPTLTGTGASGTWSINVTGTAGSLTSMNISQFSNNSGYITSYTETSTLANVTARGASTSTRTTFVEVGATKDGSDTVAAGPWFRWTNVAESRQMLTQLNASHGLTTWAYNGSAWVSAMTLTQAGALTLTSTLSASNFSGTHSGTSSGTNTGDQTNISGNAGTVTNGVYTTGNQSIGGSKTFTGGGSAIVITSSDIRSDATSDWTGDPGVQGKIQYHSNRWYIVADSSSNRIVQFRRNGTDLSYIDNSGIFQGSISGNAATAGGFTPSQTSGTANRIVVADSNGYIINNYFNASGGGSERNASGMGYFAGHNSSDYYYRSYTAAAAAALLSGQSMNISGTATNITQYTINQSVGTGNAPTFAGGTINGSLYVNANNDVTTLAGSVTLYSTGNATTSMIMFKNTTGLGYGNHGGIAGTYNTYFVMDTTDRGWVFRNATTSANIASISNTGIIAANSHLYTGGYILRTAAGQGWLSGNYASSENGSSSHVIYSIGGSYVPTATTLGNMYGIGYANAGGSGYALQMTNAAGWGLYIASNGTPYAFIGSEGNVSVFRSTILPHANNTYNLGSTSYRWANIYTNDLHLSNDGKEGGNEIDGTTGDWTIQEGEENLYIINHKNGKKFKIDLTEII